MIGRGAFQSASKAYREVFWSVWKSKCRLGGMDISEKRKPQDGRMTIMVDRQEYDIRISSIPTVHGEKLVLRISSKLNLTREKKELGLSFFYFNRMDYETEVDCGRDGIKWWQIWTKKII